MTEKKESYFWTSYSDLMTSLFFVMMVLFLLAMAVMQNEKNATEEQLRKIEELNKSIENIDKEYFVYDPDFKRHTLRNIKVSFKAKSSDLNDLSDYDRKRLKSAGSSIRQFMKDAELKLPKAQYLLIVEGQSSEDGYIKNDELSYERALSLIKYWRDSCELNFYDKNMLSNCELLVSGSGFSSSFRDPVNEKNQRFVIHIIPKPGIIE